MQSRAACAAPKLFNSMLHWRQQSPEHLADGACRKFLLTLRKECADLPKNAKL